MREEEIRERRRVLRVGALSEKREEGRRGDERVEVFAGGEKGEEGAKWKVA